MVKIRGNPYDGIRAANPDDWQVKIVPEHWRLLELDPNLHGAIAVRAKWLILARRHHPDTGGFNANVEEFVKYRNAYERCMEDCRRTRRTP